MGIILSYVKRPKGKRLKSPYGHDLSTCQTSLLHLVMTLTQHVLVRSCYFSRLAKVQNEPSCIETATFTQVHILLLAHARFILHTIQPEASDQEASVKSVKQVRSLCSATFGIRIIPDRCNCIGSGKRPAGAPLHVWPDQLEFLAAN